jgi:hypothetical protein
MKPAAASPDDFTAQAIAIALKLVAKTTTIVHMNLVFISFTSFLGMEIHGQVCAFIQPY